MRGVARQAGGIGTRASWSAATESSESPLWGRVAVGGGELRRLQPCQSQSGDFADSVTAVQNLAEFLPPISRARFFKCACSPKSRRLIHEGDLDKVS